MKKNKKMRLAKYLAECGLGSRRKCEELIIGKKIKVNDSIISKPAFNIDEKDCIEFDGKAVKLQRKIVIALNKPAGYISTASDEFLRKTVLDLAARKNQRLYPAGRLDKDSRGLIILTNDGDLVYRITHPKFNISKTYEVKTDKNICDIDLRKLEAGIRVDGKIFKPDMVKVEIRNGKKDFLRIKIHEGRKRIIRRALINIGYKVRDLKRIQIGNFIMGDIPEGKYRVLHDKDIKKLINPF